jgi:hypothetical protein
MTEFCVHLVKDQVQTGANGVVREDRRKGPSITYKITPCWVTLFQPARRAAVLGKLSSLWPHFLGGLTYHTDALCKSLDLDTDDRVQRDYLRRVSVYDIDKADLTSKRNLHS